jgi:hypothetical protein
MMLQWAIGRALTGAPGLTPQFYRGRLFGWSSTAAAAKQQAAAIMMMNSTVHMGASIQLQGGETVRSIAWSVVAERAWLYSIVSLWPNPRLLSISIIRSGSRR